MRYLGVDPGGRKLGLAVGDDETGVVTPLKVVAYGGVQQAAQTIATVAADLRAGCVVIGLPTNASGELTAACRRTEVLAQALENSGLEIVLQGEHLSTNEARRRARQAGINPNKPIDHIAAQVLLEEYLASL